MNYINEIKKSRTFFSLIGLITVMVFGMIITEDFRTLNNIITILRQASVLIILSTGLTAVLLTGNMDLSVGAAAGFIGCVCAQAMKIGIPIPIIFVLSIVLGIILGCFNAFLVGNIRLPSFIATYGTSWVLTGLSIIVMNGAVIFDLPKSFTWFGVGYISFIPVIIIFAMIIVFITYLFIQHTTLGRNIYFYGSNLEAARFSGVSVKFTLYSVFIMSSITAGLAGLMITARLNAADASMGSAYGLHAVAAVVVGGTSMLGGEGGIIGTVVGAILLTVIINIMNLIGISSFAQPMVVGLVIICISLLDTINRGKGLSFKKILKVEKVL